MYNSDCLIVGCGDIGKRILRIGHFRRCFALTRDASLQASIATFNTELILRNLDNPEKLTLPVHFKSENSVVFYLLPPPPQGINDTRLSLFLTALKKPPIKLVYISTSGVYGDNQGAWVDETTKPSPGTDRAKRRLNAEQQLLNWSQRHKTDISILRVPGIYGPDRLPLDKLRQGLPVIIEEEAPYTNLIHADDLARICINAAIHGQAGHSYNVSDGAPLKTTHYYYALADAANLPRPPAVSLDYALRNFSPIRLSFLLESRRLNVEKMRHELKPSLLYPQLKQGIEHALKTSATI